jgi:hypothetical protein
MTNSEIKKEIKRLRKLIKSYPVHSNARKEAKRLVIELKASLEAIKAVDLAKKPLIEEILRLDYDCEKYKIDLYKHSIANLKIHLEKIKARGLTKGK